MRYERSVFDFTSRRRWRTAWPGPPVQPTRPESQPSFSEDWTPPDVMARGWRSAPEVDDSVQPGGHDLDEVEIVMSC